MNKKLHKVTIEVIGYTLTTSEMEAAMQAGAMIDDVYIADYAYATEVREGGPIEGEWAVFDRVYGADGETRLHEVWPGTPRPEWPKAKEER